MSAILCRDGDEICDFCIYDGRTCPYYTNIEILDETAVGEIVVCKFHTTKEMIK